MTRIIDAFLYHNEERMLRARLELLRGCVDRHILIEGDLTYQGQPRPPAENIPDGVETHYVTLPRGDEGLPGWATGKHWERERAQRDAIADAVRCEPDDAILLVTDVDELIDPRALRRLVGRVGRRPLRLEMTNLIYGPRWTTRTTWRLPMAILVGGVRRGSIYDTRISPPFDRLVRCAGWHCTYWGGEGVIRRKLDDFAHAEISDDPNWVERVVSGDRNGRGVGNEPLVPVDPSTLPGRLRKALDTRMHLP